MKMLVLWTSLIFVPYCAHVNIDLNNGPMPKRHAVKRRAITRTIVHHTAWRHMALLGDN